MSAYINNDVSPEINGSDISYTDDTIMTFNDDTSYGLRKINIRLMKAGKYW